MEITYEEKATMEINVPQLRQFTLYENSKQKLCYVNSTT